MPTCPNGHQSAADDWCEVCGHRMASAPGAPAGAVPPPPPPMPGPNGGYGYPAPGGDATMQAEPCPQCRTPRDGQAPFCGECRYSFLTHSPTTTGYAAPPPPPPPSQAPGGSMGGLNLPPGFQQAGPPGPPPPPPAPPRQMDYESSRPQHERPEPLAPEPPRPQPPQPMVPPQQHHTPPPPGQPDYARADFGQQGQGQGYGYPQPPQHQTPPPPQPRAGGSDDWMLPPPGPMPPGQPDYARADFGQQGQGQGQGYGYPQPPQPPHQQAPHQQPPHQQEQPPQQPSTWMVTVGPDRDYFTAMMQRSGPEAAGLNLPAYSPEQRVQLTGSQVTIGRRRHSTGESPDIDLGRSPEDPGVSHQHAVLVRQPDGSWAVVDQDSTNGTTINGAEDPIQPFVPVPLKEGDRVHVGAWTTITLYRG
ncbi:FHA domain-containing protein [Streptomyces macrosporus]|uniref:FHA domain-containing protein n=1 Tax=Streptomyces macrosporus TaxID=44032 RepID=A0ABN3JTU4_9ACTN